MNILEITLLKEASIFDVPWGKIYKSETISQMYNPLLEKLKERYALSNSYSVSIGEIKPSAFHKPFIRNSGGNSAENKILYHIISGTFGFIEDGQYQIAGPGQTVFVNDDELFSFESGLEGCTFAIMTFPAFQPEQYLDLE